MIIVLGLPKENILKVFHRYEKDVTNGADSVQDKLFAKIITIPD